MSEKSHKAPANDKPAKTEDMPISHSITVQDLFNGVALDACDLDTLMEKARKVEAELQAANRPNESVPWQPNLPLTRKPATIPSVSTGRQERSVKFVLCN